MDIIFCPWFFDRLTLVWNFLFHHSLWLTQPCEQNCIAGEVDTTVRKYNLRYSIKMWYKNVTKKFYIDFIDFDRNLQRIFVICVGTYFHCTNIKSLYVHTWKKNVICLKPKLSSYKYLCSNYILRKV